MKNQKCKVAGTGIVLILCAIFSNTFAQISKEPQKETPSSTNNLDKNIEIDMSYEEKLIRLAYKKLALYNIVSRYRDGETLKKVLDNSIKFKLSDFKSGSINEIKDVLYNDIASPPNEEIIQLSRSTIQEEVNKISREKQIAYRAEWVPGKYSTMFDRNWTVEDIVKLESLKYYDIKRYTSYKVTVSLEGKSRDYNALILYHGQPENLKLEFWDGIAGFGGNLTRAWEDHRLPFGLNRRSIIQTEETYSNEDFENKVKKYLIDLKNDLISTEPAVSCPENTSSLQQCCLTQDLANFWNADSCNGWWTDINSFVMKADNSSIENYIPFYSSDNQYHIGGGIHHGRARFNPQCTIESATTQRCNVQITDQGYGDTDNDHSDRYYHVGNVAETSRSNIGQRGETISCDSAIGFAFSRCFYSCGVTLQLSVSGSGVGATATVSGGDLWRTAKAAGTTCNSSLPNDDEGGLECDYLCRRPSADKDVKYVNDDDDISNYIEDCCWYSPIVIDILGNGFDLTSATNGVMFDFNGDGVSHRISWTSANSDDAWLVLDRNENGLIDSSREMFGNYTEQPTSNERNGFLALAQFDKAEKGGNSDGKINRQDRIFDSLRLWQDVNHNGISEASELFKLLELDVKAMELDYRESRRTDEHGNRFKYKAKVRDRRDAEVGRWAFDVFLVLDQTQN